MQDYSELEKMILRTKEAEFEAALDAKLAEVETFLNGWVVPTSSWKDTDRTVANTVAAMRLAVETRLCMDAVKPSCVGGDMVPSPVHEFILSDFGNRALTLIKTEAGRA